MTIMHCGKFKGKDISALPNWYLKWMAENWSENTELNKKLCKEADQELKWRQHHGIEI